jgi:hypothetical protein
MIDLYVQPIGIWPVVGKMEACVIDVNAAEATQIGASFLYPDSLGLPVLKRIDAYIKVEFIYVTIGQLIIDSVGATFIEFKGQTHHTRRRSVPSVPDREI